MSLTRHDVFATQSGRQLLGEELTGQSLVCQYWYKVITAAISDKMYRHLGKNHLMPAEQKGCRKGSYGCKESW